MKNIIILITLLAAAVFAQDPPHAVLAASDIGQAAGSRANLALCPSCPPCSPNRKFDGYFTARYMIPGITIGAGASSFDIEAGWIWGKGTFFGIELGAGFHENSRGYGSTTGIGFNWGGTYNLPMGNSQIAYGMFTGFWSAGKVKYDEDNWHTDDIWYTTTSQEVYKNGYLGPLIKLRWNKFELLYRGILSNKYQRVDDEYYKGWGVINQFMIGLHLDSSRKRR
jgi:hypothetical protein